MNEKTMLLVLVCPSCSTEIPRLFASGLKIGDRIAILSDGYTQVCPACGHEHAAGAQFSYRMVAEKE